MKNLTRFLDMETGKLNQERLEANMDLANISRCDNAPCGETIQFFKGADSTAKQELITPIPKCLKGS